MNGAPVISPDALDRRISSGESPLLLDMRTQDNQRAFPFEARGSANLVHLPYRRFLSELETGFTELPPPARAGHVVAFCDRGHTSAEVVRLLRAAGYHAASLAGGILGWSELVFPSAVPGSESLSGGAELAQFRRMGKGCLGYALVAGGEALVIDVGRNVAAVLACLEERGARLTRVADTHLHADHISGGPAVARETGATYALPRDDAVEAGITYEPVRNGDSWRVGGVEVRAIHTPGHTDGSTSYLVGGRYLLTGDVLFVRGIGRPDLSSQGERLACVLHRTLTGTLAALPDDVDVLPAHISSPDEVGKNGVASARLGDLKRSTLARLPRDPDAFARSLLASLPDQPPNFDRIRAANRRGFPDGDPSELEFGPNRCAVMESH